WSKTLLALGISSWVSVVGSARADDLGAVQAIEQATDPSAAVTAFANGLAADRNNPRVYSAYVSRMVEFGLPAMPYHQAHTLTRLQSNSGLGWGVLAYVDARRGNMEEAVSSIVLASQFAPDHAFVQRTAGEIYAWYDTKGSGATLPDNSKAGL